MGRRGYPGCAVVDFDLAYIGEEEQYVGIEGFGEQAGGGVPVDDSFDSLEFAVIVADNGSAAAAGANYDRPGVAQLADETGFHYALGGGGGNDPAPEIAVGFDGPSGVGCEPFGLVFVVDGTHDLGGRGESR